MTEYHRAPTTKTTSQTEEHNILSTESRSIEEMTTDDKHRLPQLFFHVIAVFCVVVHVGIAAYSMAGLPSSFLPIVAQACLAGIIVAGTNFNFLLRWAIVSLSAPYFEIVLPLEVNYHREASVFFLSALLWTTAAVVFAVQTADIGFRANGMNRSWTLIDVFKEVTGLGIALGITFQFVPEDITTVADRFDSWQEWCALMTIVASAIAGLISYNEKSILVCAVSLVFVLFSSILYYLLMTVWTSNLAFSFAFLVTLHLCVYSIVLGSLWCFSTTATREDTSVSVAR